MGAISHLPGGMTNFWNSLKKAFVIWKWILKSRIFSINQAIYVFLERKKLFMGSKNLKNPVMTA